jgi:hypothetical protein
MNEILIDTSRFELSFLLVETPAKAIQPGHHINNAEAENEADTYEEEDDEPESDIDPDDQRNETSTAQFCS